MSNGTKAQAAATAALDEAESSPDTDVVELQNGIQLRVKGVPPFLIRAAVMKLQKPKPPKTKPYAGKDTEEENPDDPEYHKALQEHEALTEETAINVMLAAGTIIEHIPKGMHPPDSDEWVDADLAEFFGVTLQLDGKVARYLSWLKFYAITSEPEITVLSALISGKVGMKEEEVQKVIDSFRSRKVGGADNGVSPANAGDRDSVPANRAGRRARSRGKGSR